MTDSANRFPQIIQELRDLTDRSSLRGRLVAFARELPKTAEGAVFFSEGFDLLQNIYDAEDRRMATLDYVKEIPQTQSCAHIYQTGMEAAIIAADSLDEAHRRITELIRLAGELPKTAEFVDMRLWAWRLALGFPERPRNAGVPLEKVAFGLPKANDYQFYRRYTLLGVASMMPKEGVFLDLYKDVLRLAMRASEMIQEPYYRKYALDYIINDIKDDARLADIAREAVTGSHKAAVLLTDPFANQYAIIDLLKNTPRTDEYFDVLHDLLERALSFFSVKKWMGDIEVYDVVDFVLSAEEHGINDSKKKRLDRERYARLLTKELEKFIGEVNDVRFIDVLKPFSHVWVQPRHLRECVKSVVDHLEKLRETYHGREITRPVFVREIYPKDAPHNIHRKDSGARECLAIDLGATNTIVMRKKPLMPPDFVSMPPISKYYDKVSVVPTVLGAETNTIGADVTEANPIVGIKQMLLDANPGGVTGMDRFFRILYGHIKKTTAQSGWLSIISKKPADVLYLTVPIGYSRYRAAMKTIAVKNAKGMKVEFIEEPLAAAVGYEVAEKRDKIIMVVDFGGSTLNAMILRLNFDEVHVVAKPDRSQILGGYDIDIWLAEFLAGKLGGKGADYGQRLIAIAEEIKIELSKKDTVPFEWNGREVCSVTRAEFEEVLNGRDFYKVVDRAIGYVLRRAEKIGVKKDKIDSVLLTGGSSQIPSFKDKIAHLFPVMRGQNRIYDHSPLSAVAVGAAMYGTRDVYDRHLGMAYAARYVADNKDATHFFTIVLEKGEILPLEKTFSVSSAMKLGAVNELYLELYEAPESIIARRWVNESGIEFIKQELQSPVNVQLTALKVITLPFQERVAADTEITFIVSESGALAVKYGPSNTVVDTDIRLQ